MLKTAKIHNIVVFAVSFAISFAIAWLALSHLRHSIANAFFSNDSSDIAFVDDTQPEAVQTQSQEKSGCACPSCCAVSEVL